MVHRRLQGFDREGEDRNGERQPPPRGERRVGCERRRAGAAVDQGQGLLLSQIVQLAFCEILEEAGKEMGQRLDLAGTAVAERRHRRQGLAVEQARHRPRQARRYGGMALDNVGQAGQHHAARHPIGQRFAERGHGRDRRPPCVLLALFGCVAQMGHLPVSGGHPVDHQIRVALQQRQEGAARPIDRVQGALVQAHRLAPPGNPAKRLDGDIPAGFENQGHGKPLSRRCADPLVGSRA